MSSKERSEAPKEDKVYLYDRVHIRSMVLSCLVRKDIFGYEQTAFDKVFEFYRAFGMNNTGTPYTLGDVLAKVCDHFKEMTYEEARATLRLLDLLGEEREDADDEL